MSVRLQGETPFCLERLEGRIKKINGGTITASEGRSLLVEMVGCFVVVGRQVGRIQNSIESLKAERADDEDRMRRVEDQDTMKRFITWFANKVLPTLFSTAIIGAILWFAAVNGHITLAP